MSELTVNIYDAFVLRLMELYKPELFPEGSFDSATGWTLGDGWSFAGDEAYAVDPSSESTLSRSFEDAELGQSYDVVLTVDAVFDGYVGVSLGGDVALTSIDEAGTFEGVATVESGDLLEITANASFQGDVSDLSITKSGFIDADELTLPIKFPGVSFDPPSQGLWLEVRPFWNGSENYALEDDGASIERGFFRIGVSSQMVVTLNTLLAEAEKLVTWFKKGTQFGGARVDEQPSIGGMIEAEDRTILPVTVTWRATR